MKSKDIRIIHFALTSLLLIFVGEALTKGASVFAWSFIAFIPLIISISLVMGLLMFGWIVFRKYSLSILLISIMIMSIFIINYYKLDFRNEYLGINDLKLFSEAVGITKNVSLNISVRLLVSIAIIILNILAGFILDRKVKNTRDSRRLLRMTIVSFFVFISSIVLFDNHIYEAKNYNKSCSSSGLVSCVASDIYYSKTKKSIVVTDKMISDLLAKYDIQNSKHQETVSPNIIVIMNESLADFENIYPEYPLKERVLTTYYEDEEVITGYTVVPVFGGATANSEFEFLTGIPISTLPENIVFYNSYLTQNIPITISEDLNQRGYETLAIHPFSRTYYNRDRIYNDFGFKEYIDYSRFQSLNTNGSYVLDSEVKNEIIYQFEKQETEKPLFIFAVTMENHADHISTTSQEYVSIKNEYYPYERQLNDYIANTKNADMLFANLKEYFSTIDEPTIILMFGDHQPGIFKKIPELNSDKDFLTPYYLYSNFDIDININKFTSTHFLASSIYSILGYEMPLNFHLGSIISTEYAAITRSGYMTSEGFLTKETLSDSDVVKSINDLEIVAYDSIVGNGFANMMQRVSINHSEIIGRLYKAYGNQLLGIDDKYRLNLSK